MPNYCWNHVHMNGIRNKDLFNKDEQFDFNKIIPMPESLNIEDGTRTDDGIDLVMLEILKHWLTEPSYRIPINSMQAVKVLYNEINSHLNRFTKSTALELRAEDIDKRKALGLQALTNIVMHGYPTWYDWCCNHWGTKWNCLDTFIEDDNNVSFTTAWCIPYGIFIELSSMFPYDEITVNWEEEGGTCGVASFLDGECIQDDEYVMIDGWYDEDKPKLFTKLKLLEDK